MMDVLFENLDKMKQLTFNKTQSLFPEKIDLLLFDVTTLYFESTDVDDLRKFGYSKDHRFNTTQIVLALATNQDGLPIGYELFEGNKAEVKTLITAIQNWKKLFSIQSVCFVGDRAMFGEDNLRLLEKKGYHYIIAAKLKSLSSSLKNQILNEQHYLPQAIGDDFGWISEFAYSPFSCSLLQLQTIPKTEDIKHLLQDHLYAYAWCDQDFYALNLVEASCTLLALSDTKRQELQGSLKIFKEKEKKHYLVRAASLPTSLDQLTLPENNYNFYIHIANDHTQLLYANRSAGTLTSLPVALADQESLDIIMSNLPTDKALTAMQLRVITTLTGHQREKSINLSLHLSEKNLDDIKLLTGHSFAVHRRLIVSYKSKRAFKDQSDRQHILNKIKRVIGENGNPSKLITNAGVKQFVTKDEKANVQLDETKVKESAEWDGLHGIITNIQQESSASLLLRYSKLWIIEESFRINKHTLKMRPIFHWKPERIHAHIGICYMTFSILRHLQYQINLIKKVSIDTILDELLGVQASIYIHKKTKDRYRIPGYFSNNARKIYKAFSLERPLDATIYLP
jgi:transposase